jgi:hypothetical protein
VLLFEALETGDVIVSKSFYVSLLAALAAGALLFHMAPLGAEVSSGTIPRQLPQAHLRVDSRKISEAYGKLPLQFEANQGQTDRQVKFISRGDGYTLYLTSGDAVLVFREGAAESAQQGGSASHTVHGHKSGVVRLKLLGGNPAPQIKGTEELPGKINYLIGNDPSAWRGGIPTFAKVQYEGVYRGVDMVYHGNQRQLEYDFALEPGVSPGVIDFEIEGPKRIEIASNGDLLLGGAAGQVRLLKPRAYQLVQGSTRSEEIPSRYILHAGHRVGFALGNYDKSRPLIIDPVLSYSTYLGGVNGDAAWGIAVDSSGNAYVAGYTNSNNFPVSAGAYDTSCGSGGSCSETNADAFVTKLNASGSLVYSTFIGGTSVELAKGIAVDESGSAYITGQTSSSNFPTTSGAFQRTYGGGLDAFVAKLSADGSSLVYSTYLGGSAYDAGNAVALDALGNAYITGQTNSTNFPTLNPLQATGGGSQDGDAFVTELNTTGSALVYSTYLGGSSLDRGNGIAVDGSGNAYVAGFTRSSDFPTQNPLQAACASCPTYADAFVAEVLSGGSVLGYSTFLGGSGDDQALGITVDSTGNAYITGFTYSNNFPITQGALQVFLRGLSDAFVTKLTPDGSAEAFSTYLGGSDVDLGNSIAVLSGNIYVSGDTYSNDFPLASATQTACGTGNCSNGTAFTSELNLSGSALVFSTYLGGSGTSPAGDHGNGVAVDASGNAYLAGETTSTDLHTVNAYQATFGGGVDVGDGFVAKISLSPIVSLSNSSLTFGSQAVGTTSPAQKVTVSNTGTAPMSVSSISASGDYKQTNDCGNSVAAGSSCTVNMTFTPTASGTRTGTLTITDSASDSPQSVSLTGTASVGVSLSPSNLVFGNQLVGTTSATQTVTLSNLGSSSLTISSIAITGANPGDFAQSSNCSNSLPASGSCVINVAFTPTATGSRTASLAVSDSATGSPQVALLSGTGGSPTVSLSPTSLSFGSQLVSTTSSAQAVILTNNGTAALSITGISITGTNAGDFAQTSTCGSSLASGGSCTISITFRPTATGIRSGTLTVSDNAAGSPQTAGLTGAGLGQGGSAIKVVNAWSGKASGTTVSVPVSTAAGDDVFVAVAINTTNTSVSSVSDNAGNAYQLRRSNTNSSSRIELWSARQTAAASSVTVTIGSASNLGVVVADYAGVGGYGASDTNSGTSTNPLATGATVTGSNLVLTAFAAVGSGTYSGNTGGLRGSAVTNTGANDIGGALVDNTAPAGAQGTKVTASANLSASEAWAGVSLELQPATPPSPAVQLAAGKVFTSGTSASTTFSQANTAGDLILAVVRFNTSVTVSGITDTAGNTYKLAVGPTADPGNSWQEAIYYAGNIKPQAAPNKVVASFSGAVTSASVHILEVSQQANASVLDATAGNAGSGTALSSGPVTTQTAPELLIGAGIVSAGTASAGSGYTPLIYFNNVLVEQQSVGTASTYAGAESDSVSANWTMQLTTWH